MGKTARVQGSHPIEIKPFSKIAPTAGFFTYGEFYHNCGNNELLNQTLTILALSEKDEANYKAEPMDDIENTKLKEAKEKGE